VVESGSIFIAGRTSSTDLPLTASAFDTTIAGQFEGFLAGISSDGSALEYLSYIGGASNDFVNDMKADTTSGRVYLCGEASRVGFPLTSDAIFSESFGRPSFVSAFDTESLNLLHSTLFPCSSAVIAVNLSPVANGQVWISGTIQIGGGNSDNK
jgi:hypothetical protein